MKNPCFDYYFEGDSTTNTLYLKNKTLKWNFNFIKDTTSIGYICFAAHGLDQEPISELSYYLRVFYITEYKNTFHRITIPHVGIGDDHNVTEESIKRHNLETYQRVNKSVLNFNSLLSIIPDEILYHGLQFDYLILSP